MENTLHPARLKITQKFSSILFSIVLQLANQIREAQNSNCNVPADQAFIAQVVDDYEARREVEDLREGVGIVVRKALHDMILLALIFIFAVLPMAVLIWAVCWIGKDE